MRPFDRLRANGVAGVEIAQKRPQIPPLQGEGDHEVVEGCHPIERGTPLRLAYGHPPPLTGEDDRERPKAGQSIANKSGPQPDYVGFRSGPSRAAGTVHAEGKSEKLPHRFHFPLAGSNDASPHRGGSGQPNQSRSIKNKTSLLNSATNPIPIFRAQSWSSPSADTAGQSFTPARRQASGQLARSRYPFFMDEIAKSPTSMGLIPRTFSSWFLVSNRLLYAEKADRPPPTLIVSSHPPPGELWPPAGTGPPLWAWAWSGLLSHSI